MFRLQNIYYSRKYRPSINHILDTEKQKYIKNRIILKRNLSYSNSGGPPENPNPYMLTILLPLVIGITNYFRKTK